MTNDHGRKKKAELLKALDKETITTAEAFGNQYEIVIIRVRGGKEDSENDDVSYLNWSTRQLATKEQHNHWINKNVIKSSIRITFN